MFACSVRAGLQRSLPSRLGCSWNVLQPAVELCWPLRSRRFRRLQQCNARKVELRVWRVPWGEFPMPFTIACPAPRCALAFSEFFIFLGHMRHVRGRQQGSESYSLYLVPFRVEYLWCEARGGITFQSPGSGRASECGAAWPTLCFDLRSSRECWAALAYRDAWMGRGCVWSAARDLRARQAVLSFVLLLHRVPAPAREAGAGSFPCAETRVCVSCGSEAVSDSF